MTWEEYLPNASRRVARLALRVFAAVFLVFLALYLLGFFAPPAVDHRPISYDDEPADVVYDASANLRTETYRYDITADYVAASGERRPTIRFAATIDNGERTYVSTYRTGYNLHNRSEPPSRFYGTAATGHRKLGENVRIGFFDDGGTGSWESDSGYRYATHRNAFDDLGYFEYGEPNTTLVENNATHYVARMENDTVTSRVGYPLRLPTPLEDGDSSLTVVVDKRTDRITDATFLVENQSSSTRLRADYDFHRGWLVRTHRPVGTYPPGVESIIYRVDLGMRVIADAVPLQVRA